MRDDYRKIIQPVRGRRLGQATEIGKHCRKQKHCKGIQRMENGVARRKKHLNYRLLMMLNLLNLVP